MRNLVVCCDGTWNTPDQEEGGVPTPTNVVRLKDAVAEKDASGNKQEVYYHPGVGTEGKWWEKAAGGAAGVGLTKSIKSAYKWLCDEYETDDRIYLFGFSRGAYTVRSLAGMIDRCGLADLSNLDDTKLWETVEAAFKAYRDKDHSFGGRPAKIHFLGVWDTVGALGIPEDMGVLKLLNKIGDHTFHDTQLSDSITHARHAIALDERRGSFTPTLWKKANANQDAVEKWFAGVHSDVGGGYREIGLANCALQWMIKEAKGKDLAFEDGMVSQVKDNPRGAMHDSVRGMFKFLPTAPRPAPLVAAGNDKLHASVEERLKNPPIFQAPYRRTRVLQPGDEAKNIRIYAGEVWNDTYLYLEEGGVYKFTAEGQWLDGGIPAGPSGSGGGFSVAKLFRTRRQEKSPWFMLMGEVACRLQADDPDKYQNQVIPIGDGTEATAEKSGYLYCYANDAWRWYYANNCGSVTLTVKRVS